jgi:IMP dehydrogenase
MIVTEVEIGGTKRGRIAYSFDDIALVPTRRTRNPEDVSTNWKIDAYDFSFPIMAAPMDSVVSPDVAINYGKVGGTVTVKVSVNGGCNSATSVLLTKWSED